MALVHRFTLPEAVKAGHDIFIQGVGLFTAGVLDIPITNTAAITALQAISYVTDLGQLDNAVSPPPVPIGDPYPQYLTAAELVSSVSTGTDTVAQTLKTVFDAEILARGGGALPFVRAEIYDDFTGKSGALNSSVALSGQTWTTTGNISLTVSGGALTDTATSGSAGYGLIHAAGNLTYMAAEFAFAAGSTDGALGVLAFSTGTLVAGTVSPAHVVITPGGWIYYVVEATGVITQIASGSFTSRLATDGVTLYTLEVVISTAEQTSYLRLPDGSVTAVSDSRINQPASWLCIEDFYAAPTTDTKPRTARVAAHSYPLGRDPRASAVRTLARLAAPVWTTVTPTAPFTATRTLQLSKDPRGIVRARGVLKTNGATNGTQFTIPVGFRPPADTLTVVPATGASTPLSVLMGAAGAVNSLQATDMGNYYWDNVTWSAV